MTAAGRPLRVLAIPLAHLPTSQPGAPPLIYWHISQRIPAASTAPPPSDAQSAPSNPSSSTILTRPALLAGFDYARPATWPDWATQKASSSWLALSEGEREGNITRTWKYKTWRTGEALMDKIACEEWALKNVQTRLEPWTGEVKRSGESVEVDETGGERLVIEPKKAETGEKLQLLFPPSLASHDPLSLLRSHLAARIPYHKTYLTRSIALVPVLLPIGLIPVLPNLPMFYVLWRAWSHWKAKLGGEYVQELLVADKIRAVQSEDLERVIREGGHARSAGDEHAPDETSTPESIRQASRAPASPELHEKIPTAGAQKKLEESLPAPEKVDEAPDATATPASQVFHATNAPSSSAPSPVAQAQSARNSASDDDERIRAALILKPGAIPALARAFDLSAPEVVDITRAVEQAAIRLREQGGKAGGA